MVLNLGWPSFSEILPSLSKFKPCAPPWQSKCPALGASCQGDGMGVVWVESHLGTLGQPDQGDR